MTKKAFSDLTPMGQTRRLNKYKAEREERGTTEVLARLVRVASIKDIAGDNKLATFRLAAYSKETEKTRFFTASAFIKQGKESLENFYASLKKGQLVAVEYKENKGYTNIYNMMDRSDADKRSAAEKPAEKAVADAPLEA